MYYSDSIVGVNSFNTRWENAFGALDTIGTTQSPQSDCSERDKPSCNKAKSRKRPRPSLGEVYQPPSRRRSSDCSNLKQAEESCTTLPPAPPFPTTEEQNDRGSNCYIKCNYSHESGTSRRGINYDRRYQGSRHQGEAKGRDKGKGKGKGKGKAPSVTERTHQRVPIWLKDKKK